MAAGAPQTSLNFIYSACVYDVLSAPPNLQCNEVTRCSDGPIYDPQQRDSATCLRPKYYAIDEDGVIQTVMNEAGFLVTCNGSTSNADHCGTSSFSSGTTSCSCTNEVLDEDPCNLSDMGEYGLFVKLHGVSFTARLLTRYRYIPSTGLSSSTTFSSVASAISTTPASGSSGSTSINGVSRSQLHGIALAYGSVAFVICTILAVKP